MLTTACADASGSAAAIVRDSSGVRIVESSGPAWSGADRWALDSVPLVDIGGSSADPHYDLLQVTDAARLDDGRILVMNNGVPDLRFYDARGTWLSTTGRAGDGPGEFRGVSTIQREPGDTIELFDYQLRRLDRIAPDGAFLSSTPLLASAGRAFMQPLARLADGSWVATAQEFSPGSGSGVRRDTLALLHLPAAMDAISDTIGRFPATEMYVQVGGSGTQRFVSFSSVSLGLSTTFAAADSLVYVGNPERYEIEGYRPDGGLALCVRRPVPRAPVDPADLSRRKDADIASAPPRWKERIVAKWKNAPVPERMPAYGTIRTDQLGNLWVEHVRILPADSGAADVFAPDGRLLGTVALPPDFRITEIGADYLLGVWKDDVDLEHVRLYRLRKPGVKQELGR